ncbi:MAG: aminoglycoside phosphotransferase family protein, partial [Natronospirillum sp.]
MNVNIPPAAVAHCELPLTIEALASGTGSAVWHLQSGRGDFVWRQFRPAEWTPGADHSRERRVMEALGDKPWMPKVARWEHNGVLMGWRDGRNPERNALSVSARERLLNHILELWHTSLPEEPAYDYEALVQAYAGHAPDTPEIRALRCRLMTGLSHWPHAKPCLTHHDLHSDNLLVGDDGWCILDWEYAA